MYKREELIFITWYVPGTVLGTLYVPLYLTVTNRLPKKPEESLCCMVLWEKRGHKVISECHQYTQNSFHVHSTLTKVEEQAVVDLIEEY